MKKQALLNKLNKIGVSHRILDLNGYNMDVVFTINNTTFRAGFTVNNDEIQDFCKVIAYDKANQEMQRVFYSSFNKLLQSVQPAL